MRESNRLRQLSRYHLPDAGRMPGLERLSDLTRMVFASPMAAVTAILEDKQHFLSRSGFRCDPLDRPQTFCSRTIEGEDVFVVRDAAAHPDFSSSPLVTGEPGVRFYAGAPIYLRRGLAVGALCVMDTSPRTFLSEDCRLLQMLAEEAAEQIRGHRRTIALRREISARRTQNAALLEQKELLARNARMFRQMAEIAKVGGWSYGPGSREIVWSEEIYRVLEMEPGSREPRAMLLEMMPPDDRRRFRMAVRQSVRSGEPFNLELRVVTKAGKTRWARIKGEAARDGRGATIVNGAFQDITDQREAEEVVKRLATVDTLTDLPNRDVFRAAVSELVASPEPAGVDALLLLDLDDFKDINDTLGHDAGDWLLHRMARRLRQCIGRSDTIGRLGGDEFGVLLRNRPSTGEVAAVAQLILDAATSPISYRGHALRVGASVGIAVRGEDTPDAAALLKAADIALYAAKRSGGERFSFYSPSIGEMVERRHRLFQEVRTGLDRDEFLVAYQPVVHLRSGQIRGLEALVRWQHPQRGLLSAGEFIDALDDAALGRLISGAVAKKAIAQFADWRRGGLPAQVIGINISVGQVRDPSFADSILDLLAANDLPPEALVAEITEGVLLGRGSESIMRRVKALHEKGVRIALDDFGTGFASLSHLREMPVDTIKIDASFVGSMLGEPADRTIVRSIIELAHGLGKAVVAEGVESREVHTLLNLMSCEFGQGYFYAPPMLAPDVPRFIGDWTDTMRQAV